MSDDLKVLTEPEPQEKTTIPSPPSFGFDKEGYFFLKIHSGLGFLSMMGFLNEGTFWLRERMKEFENKKKQDTLIKPAKGLSRFNSFFK